MSYITNERFIDRYIKKWGKWDFGTELMNYVDNDTPITLICLIHGKFEITPHALMRVGRCQKCGFEKRNKEKMKTTEQYIKECLLIHGDRYDYSETIYNGDKNKTSAICHVKDKDGNEHGRFEFIASNHIGKSNHCGCPKCNGGVKYKWEDVKRELEHIHPNYDFSKSEYINGDTDIDVVCPKHGIFHKSPYRLKLGYGCPKCNSSYLEHEIRNFLNDNAITFEEQKTFEWMKYKLPLKLDFYLPDYNIAIECQGRQHFEIVGKYGGKQGFQERLILDKNKNVMCKENNVNLLYYINNRTSRHLEKHNIVIPAFYENIFNNKVYLLEEIIAHKEK